MLNEEQLITSGLLLEECDEYLCEMASEYPRNSNPDIKIMAAVNPTEDRVGECYFKVYDAPTYGKARHVIRLDFFKPITLLHRKSTKLPWSDINKQDLKDVDSFLDEESKRYPGYTIWDALKYDWNTEKSLDVGTIWEYCNGEYDLELCDNPDYVPSTLEPPTYADVDLNDWKRKLKR